MSLCYTIEWKWKRTKCDYPHEKKIKEIKKNWMMWKKKNPTHQLNGSQLFFLFFYYCTVYADELGLSYCDDDVKSHGLMKRGLWTSRLYRLLHNIALLFCKWKLRTIKFCFKVRAIDRFIYKHVKFWQTLLDDWK